MMGPEGPFCQSCGMPLSRDEKGGGTEADGSKSAEYCSHCYQKGRFTEPALTVGQMTERVKSKMREMGVPEPMVNNLARGIPDLRRWKR